MTEDNSGMTAAPHGGSPAAASRSREGERWLLLEVAEFHEQQAKACLEAAESAERDGHDSLARHQYAACGVHESSAAYIRSRLQPAVAAEAPSSAERAVDILEDAGVPEEWRTHYANLLAEVLTPALAAENGKLREAPEPLKADFTKMLPGRVLDDTTYQQIELALDRVDAPCQADDGRWLKLHERIEALRSLTPREGSTK